MRIEPFVSQPEAVRVTSGDTLREAARRIHAMGVGSAVVVDEDETDPGIITERDLLRAVAEGADPSSTKVGDYTTQHAVTVTQEWHVVDAAKTMIERGFRHLIVTDERGRIAGVLSIRDMVRALLEHGQRTLAG